VAKKEARKFDMTVNGYIGFLFIHALLHLKGLDHGDTMDKAEKKYCLKYGLR
jgi:ssRNA-specific RNase YbeY (16S rRNA maturation enzyme)